MTYEEKLDLIIRAIHEAKKATRKGHQTTLYIDSSNGLDKLSWNDVHDILLKLQDDERLIEVSLITNRLLPVKDQPTKPDYFRLDVLEKFDSWFEKHLLNQDSSLENLSYTNLLKIFDLMLDIEEQLQLSNSPTIQVPLLPNLMKFNQLFPADTIGMRETYKGYRWDSAEYLKEHGFVADFAFIDDYSYGQLDLTVNLVEFKDFMRKTREEYKKRQPNKGTKETPETAGKSDTEEIKTALPDEQIAWPEDFQWEGKNFIFGQFGRMSFTSNERQHIFKTLTDKKGGWATIDELKGTKDAGYVRSTIKQIEDRLPTQAKGHILIVSTQDAEGSDKPVKGAYKIKVTP